jgi:hypothetical protein
MYYPQCLSIARGTYGKLKQNRCANRQVRFTSSTTTPCTVMSNRIVVIIRTTRFIFRRIRSWLVIKTCCTSVIKCKHCKVCFGAYTYVRKRLILYLNTSINFINQRWFLYNVIHLHRIFWCLQSGFVKYV